MTEVRALSGRPVTELTLEAVRQGEIGLEDLRIHPETLERQAAIAEQHGNPQLAGNLRRAAELTRLAGWMAYDLEQHGLAQRYLIQALRLAREADDHALGGEILAGMSHQAVYIGRADDTANRQRCA